MPRIRRRRPKKRTPSRVGSLGSKARPQSGVVRKTGVKPATQPFRRQQYRIRRPLYRRPIGYVYPRRYRARPMSSGGCFVVFIILAIFWFIYLAPSITISLDATLAMVLPIAVVIVLFIIALGFITRLVDDDDEGNDAKIKVIEHETVLVVCPYCGAKNEQGVTTCKNCDAEI